MGQDLALRQISDAICDHLATKSPSKPLVLSIHGPPGVGKSLFHQEAARALYSTHPSPTLECPGPDCRGYKVLFGLDFTADEKHAQHAALRHALSEHMKSTQEAFLVIEEYDKLDCEMRGFFRHLLEGGHVGNYSLARSIVVLESNTGYTSLHSMLQKAGKRENIAPEHAQRHLKDLVFSRWQGQGCEQRTDTLKMVGLVDFFLPFFPLERQHVEQLFELRLQEKAATVAKDVCGGSGGDACRVGLTWDASVVKFLTDKVDFEGLYPIEGGKEVGTVMTRYVSRPVRQLVGQLTGAIGDDKDKKKNKGKRERKKGGVGGRKVVGRLVVQNNKKLEVAVVDAKSDVEEEENIENRAIL